MSLLILVAFAYNKPDTYANPSNALSEGPKLVFEQLLRRMQGGGMLVRMV